MLVELKKAAPEDAECLWRMQREAFRSIYERYHDDATSPYMEPMDRTLQRIEDPETCYYLIYADNRPVGGIRVQDAGEKGKRISPLFILPEAQGKGIAQQAILLAEEKHGSTDWTLDTILQEKGNCHLYEKMGYRQTGRSILVNDHMTLVLYRK